MFNANTATRNWLRTNLGDELVVENHFAAVSSKPERAVEFGVPRELVFPIWDWLVDATRCGRPSDWR